MCTCVCMFVCICVGNLYAIVFMWWPEDNLWEFVLSFHHVGTEDSTQIIMLGDKHLYQPSWIILIRLYDFLNIPLLQVKIVLISWGLEMALHCTTLGKVYMSVYKYICTNLCRQIHSHFISTQIHKSICTYIYTHKYFICIKNISPTPVQLHRYIPFSSHVRILSIFTFLCVSFLWS